MTTNKAARTKRGAEAMAEPGTPIEPMDTLEGPKFRVLKDGRTIPVFAPGPDGGPSAEEQAWADEEQKTIIAQRDARLKAENEAEKKNYAGKQERAAAARQKRTDLEAAVKAMTQILADQEKRILALEGKPNG